MQNNVHYTHDPRILALATQPHQLVALAQISKLSLEISKDRERLDRFFSKVKQTKEKVRVCIK